MFEIETGLIFWTTVSFGLLVLVLYKLALPALVALLSQREKLIADSLLQVSKNQEKAEQLMAEYKLQLAEARKHADQILGQSRVEGEKLKQEILSRAEKQAQMVLDRSRQDLLAEKEKLSAGIRESVAQLVVAAAGRLMRKTITVDDHRHFIEESLKEAEDGTN